MKFSSDMKLFFYPSEQIGWGGKDFLTRHSLDTTRPARKILRTVSCTPNNNYPVWLNSVKLVCRSEAYNEIAGPLSHQKTCNRVVCAFLVLQKSQYYAVIAMQFFCANIV